MELGLSLIFFFKTWALIELACEKRKAKDDNQNGQQSVQPASPRKQHVTKNSYNLSPCRLIPGDHLPGI
jgi:hypothetical protein